MIKVENKGSDIFIFGRQNKVPTITKQTFKPYFYYEDKDGEYNTIDNKHAKIKYTNNPKEVGVEREKYFKTYESDIVYTNRFIIDTYSKIEKDEVRVCYLDIEIKRTDKGYESPKKANNPILTIGVYDSFDNKHTTFCLNKTHNDEKEMVKDFMKWFIEKDPDVIVAWNGDQFDFPFIINRMKKLKLNPNALARQTKEFRGVVKFKKSGFKELPIIEGRILFDLMFAYKKMVSGEGRESWSLDYISQYEGVGEKEKYKGELDNLYETDIDKFISYNIKDVELLVLLDRKLNIIDFFDEVRRMCFCQFEDVFLNSKIADCLCLKRAKEIGVVLPKTEKKERAKFKGGFVHGSQPKLHKNIATFDMKSLYPSIMIGFNTSYETLLPKKEDNCINVYDKYFYKKDLGIIPSIVKPLLDKRARAKKQMKQVYEKHGEDSREYKSYWLNQYALKVIANSFYGVMGFPLFRLYKTEVAATITFTARTIINEVEKWFNKKGLKVVYGDTDSVFVEMKDNDIDKMNELNKEINKYFKEYFRGFGVSEDRNIFELEFEKVFKTVFFKRKADGKGAKKRYAGRVVLEDGEPVDKFTVTGFESKRSDTPTIGRKFLYDILKMVCHEKQSKEINDFILKFRKELKSKPVEVVAIPMGISKKLNTYGNVIHIRAARNANKYHNAQIKGGDKIKYVYITHTNMNVIGFKSGRWMWKGYKVDYKMMERRIIDMKIQPIYESLGWKYPWEIYKPGKKKKVIKFEDTMKQTGLWQ